MLALLLFLAWSLACCLQISRYANLRLTHLRLTVHHCVIEFNFYWGADLQWLSSIFVARADVRTGPTPHPKRSRISCCTRSQLRDRHCYNYNRFPGERARINWQ
jgi:hypothetical protein